MASPVVSGTTALDWGNTNTQVPAATSVGRSLQAEIDEEAALDEKKLKLELQSQQIEQARTKLLEDLKRLEAEQKRLEAGWKELNTQKQKFEIDVAEWHLAVEAEVNQRLGPAVAAALIQLGLQMQQQTSPTATFTYFESQPEAPRNPTAYDISFLSAAEPPPAAIPLQLPVSRLNIRAVPFTPNTSPNSITH